MSLLVAGRLALGLMVGAVDLATTSVDEEIRSAESAIARWDTRRAETIAARMLLKRHGHASTIHFGVERVGEDVLNGHAWLTCGETVVTGGAELDRYAEIHHLK